MKNIVIALIGMLGLASCSDEVKFRTIVNEDGSIEKTITLTTSDSTSKSYQYLGIADSLVWEYKRIRNVTKDSSSLLSSLKKVEEISSIPINKEGKDSTVVHERISYDHQFSKKFVNTDTFNNVLQKQKSNHLSISASFNKRFRWFYTYFDYAETFGPINNFDYPVNDYLNEYDFKFIESLPAEGKPLSKADSVFLENLNTKVFEQYGEKAYTEALNQIIVENLTTKEAKTAWIKHAPAVFSQLLSESYQGTDDMVKILDSLKLKSYLNEESYALSYKKLEDQLAFIMWASDSQHTIEIEMPGKITAHNADSVNNRVAIWKPSSLKFLLKPYTFQVSARKINEWAWVVSAVFIGFVVYLSVKYTKKAKP